MFNCFASAEYWVVSSLSSAGDSSLEYLKISNVLSCMEGEIYEDVLIVHDISFATNLILLFTTDNIL